MSKFDNEYALMDESIMPLLNVPPICCNKMCGSWSSPSYCYERFMEGYDEYPVCVRSAILFNRPLLPLPKVKPVQYSFDF